MTDTKQPQQLTACGKLWARVDKDAGRERFLDVCGFGAAANVLASLGFEIVRDVDAAGV